jgi:molybdate transport system regulatory protein
LGENTTVFFHSKQTDQEKTQKEVSMEFGARNKIRGQVKTIKKGDIMSLVKFTVTNPHEMASVLTTESLENLDVKAGDEVELIIKAIHVLPVK